MVAPTGIEPVTLGLWVLRSNQLSYGATIEKVFTWKSISYDGDLVILFLFLEYDCRTAW